MPETGRILIADDEETFSRSTADLLRQLGYECDCAPDGAAAAALLRTTAYDLLIADIKMPGNPELELIRELSRVAEGTPVILVTGYPSLRTAVQSIQLPVIAYLTKPIEFDELKAHVHDAVERSRAYHAIRDTRKRLEESCGHLNDIEKALKANPKQKPSTSVSSFIELTFLNIFGAITDLRNLTEALGAQNPRQEACHLLNCPRLDTLSKALNDTVEILEHTKTSFKSKELGDLRKKLESVLK